jgi:hypothetical protein
MTQKEHEKTPRMVRGKELLKALLAGEKIKVNSIGFIYFKDGVLIDELNEPYCYNKSIDINGLYEIYEDDDSIFSVDDAITPETIQCCLLELCGCGLPADNILFIRNILRLLHDGKEFKNYSDFKEAFNYLILKDMEVTQFFILYMLDRLKLTQHGGSVVGSWPDGDLAQLIMKIEDRLVIE